MMLDSSQTQITWRLCPEWSSYGPTLLRQGKLFQMLKVNYLHRIFIVHSFDIEKNSLISMVRLLHFKKCFGIVSSMIGKVSHLEWHTVVFILSVLGVGWHYASVEECLLVIQLPFPPNDDRWMNVKFIVKWGLTPDNLSTGRKSSHWVACHFKNFETGSEAHPAPSLIGSRGSSPWAKLAEVCSWPLSSISCWGYGSISAAVCLHGVHRDSFTICIQYNS